jgi:hypothetical protein
MRHYEKASSRVVVAYSLLHSDNVVHVFAACNSRLSRRKRCETGGFLRVGAGPPVEHIRRDGTIPQAGVREVHNRVQSRTGSK